MQSRSACMQHLQGITYMPGAICVANNTTLAKCCVHRTGLHSNAQAKPACVCMYVYVRHYMQACAHTSMPLCVP